MDPGQPKRTRLQSEREEWLLTQNGVAESGPTGQKLVNGGTHLDRNAHKSASDEENGMAENGRNENGMNENGMDENGMDENGMDENGMNVEEPPEEDECGDDGGFRVPLIGARWKKLIESQLTDHKVLPTYPQTHMERGFNKQGVLAGGRGCAAFFQMSKDVAVQVGEAAMAITTEILGFMISDEAWWQLGDPRLATSKGLVLEEKHLRNPLHILIPALISSPRAEDGARFLPFLNGDMWARSLNEYLCSGRVGASAGRVPVWVIVGVAAVGP
ncbi:hypothetical protein GNI_063460 [Gregarina niphandrodes]|uniref:Uncharacterized protein n=1 Tax=Gregarina niphandrodes TaxID=110365 RepID=A0A023B862_GRENI|nr:hypothetical protein GNI_063460 [Gregarina niphandrodes]EZG68205.1 hypothetical protein GNI_063460 [Gregarina niphandrodes]|eukprot:XP_011130038.1 hypothetical protein GNI_063460 [Gregarina niphandrodes]